MTAMTMVMTNSGGLLDSAGPLITPDMTSPPPRRPSIRQRMRSAWEAKVAGRVREAWNDPSKKPKMVRRLRIASVVLGVAVVVGGYFAFRPKPQPDYLDAGMDDILDYTLLTDEFNKLPVKERLALISQLVTRLKGMDSGDSAMMAAFAAGIAGSARDQLMSNVSHLAIDIWDEYAVKYDDVPAEDREKFLEEAFLDFTKSMESVAGMTREVSDEQRLDRARRDAQRDSNAVREGRGPSGEQLGRMFTFMRDGVGSHASPHQRARAQVLMRDMARHFREGGGKSGGGR
jgi:hypothetical protein